MQLWYGSASLPVNGASASVRYRTVLADTGRPVRYIGAIDVLAYLDGTSQDDLTTKELIFNSALIVPYRDLVLRQDSGAPSGTRLFNNSSMSGVRLIDGPRYENEAKDGEYTVVRTCRFTMEASYLIPNAQNAVLSFQESVTYLGNNSPRVTWRHLVNAGPVPQIVYPSTTAQVIQTGSAVGHLAYPPFPGPLWPFPFEKGDRRRITFGSPKREGQALIEWPVSWSYEYESDGPLAAFPSIPPL